MGSRSDHRVLVFGISGIGKSTACEDYASRNPGILVVSSAELIRHATSLSDEELRTSSAGQILARQSLLAGALEQRLAGRDVDVLMDAHSFIDNDGDIVKIPGATIASMQPTGLILLEAPAEEVQRRRANDSRRRPARSLCDLEYQMRLSRNLVTEYSKSIGIPLQFAAMGQAFRLDPYVEALG